MFKSVVKVCGSTVKLQLILDILSAVEAGGIRGVAVKCLDITKNSLPLTLSCSFAHEAIRSQAPSQPLEPATSGVSWARRMCIRDSVGFHTVF